MLRHCLVSVCTTRSVASISVTSACSASTSSPSSFAACCSVFGLRPVIATRAPSALDHWAVANPMPLLPPVIKPTLLASFIGNPPSSLCAAADPVQPVGRYSAEATGLGQAACTRAQPTVSAAAEIRFLKQPMLVLVLPYFPLVEYLYHPGRLCI